MAEANETHELIQLFHRQYHISKVSTVGSEETILLK